ncbi:NUDIX domain-containing protein [Candidatus Pacearchaeota archaeon]|nr:MAG: NUDIX domain-containing protein [Candidatus Pacearchaeota archaeon]
MARVLVVPREKLFKEKHFTGFCQSSEFNFLECIEKNGEFAERNEELENNRELLQIIPYVWIVDKGKGRVFVYRRASKESNYQEKRLFGKWSGGVGGHIEVRDGENSNAFYAGMRREIEEEVSIKNYKQPIIIGYLNTENETGSVYKVHFGVVGVLETSEEIQRNNEELAQTMFLTPSEVDKLFENERENVEVWSLVSWPHVRKIILS